MNSGEAINSLTVSILGGAASLFLFLLLMVWNRVGKVSTKIEATKDEVLKAIKDAMESMEKTLEREKKEAILADKRLNILDRVGSAVADDPFDSKLIAQGSGQFPNTRKIQRVLDAESRGGRA